MQTIDAATLYDLSGGSGELLLIILIAFGLGALFGRTIMSPRKNKQLRLFSPSKSLSKLPKELTSGAEVIITPLPRS